MLSWKFRVEGWRSGGASRVNKLDSKLRRVCSLLRAHFMCGIHRVDHEGFFLPGLWGITRSDVCHTRL